MAAKRTYVLSVHAEDEYAVLKDVRTGRDARLEDLSEVGPQIDRWTAQDRGGVAEGDTPAGDAEK